MWENQMKLRVALTVMGAAMAASGAALASPELQAEIAAGCQVSLNWSAAACQCLSVEAASLNDTQQGFLAATLNEQEAEAGAHALKMTPAETMQASMFMVNAGPACQ
jgi:hypothetical protein